MSQRSAPPPLQVLATLIRVTQLRLVRGRALWISALIASLPLLAAIAFQGDRDVVSSIGAFELLVLVLLPPMFVASSIGEEIEERTTTYLWSRPIPRWTVIVGKLVALAPIAMALVLAGWGLAVQLGSGTTPTARSLIGLAAGTLAVSATSAGLATLVPRNGMALSLIYLVIFDLALGVIPAPVQNISITRQVRLLGGFNLEYGDPSGMGQPAITMAIIAAVWLAVALWRSRRLES